jgi:hypothetical protein
MRVTAGVSDARLDRKREVTMVSRVGFALMAVVLLGILLVAPTPAYAQSCSTNAECAAGNTCAVKWNFLFFKIRECQPTRCNVDGDCTGGTLCLLGVCRVGCRSESDCPAGNLCTNSQCVAPTQHPPPGTIPGEGRKCNPPDGSRPPGWATDSHGKALGACPQGTVCSNRGFCQKPLQ